MRAAVAIVLSLVALAPLAAAETSTAPPEWPPPPVELLLLGTFHFSDAGLDSYRPKFDVDIRSPERQAQLEALLQQLEAFAPTRIAVEALPSRQAELDERYAAYRAGELELTADEVDQIALRLAARLGHDRLYAVDAQRRFYEPWVDPDEFAEANGQQQWLDPELWERYERLHEFHDELKTRQTLIEHLLHINAEEQLRRSHGQYLIGNFEVGTGDDYPGVDSKTAWYNRNLKIFANLQRIADFENGDRILLLIGSGHVPILRHAAQASPQFRLVEVAEVLSAPAGGD